MANKGKKRIKLEKKAMRNTIAIIGAFLLLMVNSFILAFVAQGVLDGASCFGLGNTAVIIALLDPAVAAVGLCLVVVQLNQENQGGKQGRIVEQQRFLLEYNKAFIENSMMNQVEASLEQYDQQILDDKDLITDENRQSFVNYLVYLEGLAPLVLDGVMELKVIDNLMAYRFFLAVNNPVVQRDQLFKWPGYYLGCFRLYREWAYYRKNKDLEILRGDSSPLDGWEDFEKWLSIAEEVGREE